MSNIERRAQRRKDRLSEWRLLLKKISDDRLNQRTALVTVGPLIPANAIDDLAEKLATQSLPRSLREAFSYFGLDAQKPAHVHLLLIMLTDACFGRRKGRRKGSLQWTRARYILLSEHFDKIKRDHPKITNQEAAKLIKKTFPTSYEHTTIETLRQRLSEARRRRQQLMAMIAPSKRLTTLGM